MAAKRAYLPETPEELTPEWLSAALDGPVDAVDQHVLGDGQGFMGDVLQLDLQSQDPTVPRTLVAKLPKKANRVFGEMLGVYEREIMFFREFGGDLPVRAPKLYFSEFDRDKGSEKQGEILRSLDRAPLFLNSLISSLGAFVAGSKKRRYMLLIEFFGDMQPGDQLVGLDLSACQQVLRSIAPMHRKFWRDSSLNDHFWLLELDIDARIRQGMYNKHVDQYTTIMGPQVAPHLTWLKRNGERLLRSLVADAPQTLLHCDLRLDNVVFDGERCAFIDFQLVRRGPAAYDVAYFISSALHAEAREADVDALLADYHHALDVADYSLDTLKRDYQRALMVVLGSLASVDDVELGDGRGRTMMDAWLKRLTARAANIPFEELLD